MSMMNPDGSITGFGGGRISPEALSRLQRETSGYGGGGSIPKATPEQLAMMQQRFGRGGSPYGGRFGGMGGGRFGGMGGGRFGQRQPPWGGRFGQRRGGGGMQPPKRYDDWQPGDAVAAGGPPGFSGDYNRAQQQAMAREMQQRSLMPRGRLGDTGGTPPDFRGGSFDTGGLAGSLRGNYQDVDMEAVRDRLANVFQRGGRFPQFGRRNDPVRGMEDFQGDGYGGRFAGMQRFPYGGGGEGPMPSRFGEVPGAMNTLPVPGGNAPLVPARGGAGPRPGIPSDVPSQAPPGYGEMPIAPVGGGNVPSQAPYGRGGGARPLPALVPARGGAGARSNPRAMLRRQLQANKQVQPVAQAPNRYGGPGGMAAGIGHRPSDWTQQPKRYRQPQMRRLPQRPQMKTSFAQQLPMQRGGRTPGNFGPMNR